MQPIVDHVQDRRGNALQGVSVLVKLGATPATIFDLAGVPQTNPITTDADGEFAFRAANAEYTLEISGPGISGVKVRTLRLYDPDETDTYGSQGAPAKVPTLLNPVLKDYELTHEAVSITAGAITLDFNAGNSKRVLLTANITSIAISSWPAGYAEMVVDFVQDATGGRTVAGWPAAVKWAEGVAYTASTPVNAIDRVSLSSNNGGGEIKAEFRKGYA